MILSQKQIEEIAAAVTEDFNKFFFGIESEKVRIPVQKENIQAAQLKKTKCIRTI